jgi:predicted Abi (CAAX) family protease
MKELTPFLEKLATQFGTTIDKLWEALLRQARLDGILSAVYVFIVFIVSILVFRFVLRKTTPQKGEIYPDWENEESLFAWFIFGIFIFFSGLFILVSIDNLTTAFLNPEYWALREVLTFCR